MGPLSRKRRRNLADDFAELLLTLCAVYISLRQASEWGMRALQGSFCRLKARLTSDKKARGDIIKTIILLHNFRTEFMGINQIATVFDPEHPQFINLDGYARLQRYFVV